MLSYVAGLWKELPNWAKGGVIVVLSYLLARLLKALYRREGWKWWMDRGQWLAILIVVNYWWGVSGLLIAIAFAGGLMAWEMLSYAERAEKRRRNRLLRAMQWWLRAKHERCCGHLRFDEGRVGYDEYIKANHGVLHDDELLDRFDEQGITAEEFDSMRAAVEAEAAAEKAERERESATGRPP